MSEQLKGKAKTNKRINHEINKAFLSNDYFLANKLTLNKWVLLSDAETEIQKLQNQLTVLAIATAKVQKQVEAAKQIARTLCSKCHWRNKENIDKVFGEQTTKESA